MRGLDSLKKLDTLLAVRAKIAKLEEQEEALKAEVTSALLGEPEQKYSYKGHEFALQYRKKWGYSPAYRQAEEELKAHKKLEEVNGSATLEGESVSLVVKKARTYVDKKTGEERRAA
jgi:hypothetical protein